MVYPPTAMWFHDERARNAATRRVLPRALLVSAILFSGLVLFTGSRLSAQPPGVYFFDDMEGDTSGWIAGSAWHLTSFPAHSPTHAWNFGVLNTESRLMSPSIDLRSAVHPVLSLWFLSNFDDFLGHAIISVTRDNGATVQQLALHQDTNGHWLHDRFDISAFAGDASVRVVVDGYASTVTSLCTIDDVEVFERPQPAPFGKLAPANGATTPSVTTTISWEASDEADTYEYCVDATNNNTCDGTWTNTPDTEALLPSLDRNTTYWWQVRARSNVGVTEANAGTWWTFTTPEQPNSFVKSAPGNGTTNQPVTLDLSWTSSAGSVSYEYCVDTTNNDACDSTWTSTAATSASVSGLSETTTYWWQVRARNSAGVTESNGGTWWSFRTTMQPGDFAKVTPPAGVGGQALDPTLAWTGSSAATSYEYCVETHNGPCDSGWKSAGTGTNVHASGLSGNTHYFWQIRARNSVGTTEANFGVWYDFWTAGPPGAFTKTTPLSPASTRTLTPIVSWEGSRGAASYEYCVDTTHNDACDGAWTTTPDTSAALRGLAVNTDYWWQVRARNADGAVEANSGTWWTFRTGATTNDFDGDGRTDRAVFRASTGGWYVLRSGTNNTASFGVSWGLSTDVPMPGDYDGDGKTDPTIFRPSTGLWAILKSSTNYTSATYVFWGLSTDVPVPADFDGDGRTDPAIFRPSTGLWAMLKSSNGYSSAAYVSWGLSTDVPMPSDYDGDGKADPAVFRPSTGGWYALRSSSSYGSYFGVVWGLSTDVPVPADYDGDGKTDPAVFRPSTGGWYVLQSSADYASSLGVVLGVSTDVPVPGDYDGDGKTDFAVFRPSTGVWLVLKSAQLGLSHWWQLDEASGSVALDTVGGSATDGTLGPGAHRTSGHVGSGALQFDAFDSDGYVNMPASAFALGTNDFTISFWMTKAPDPTGSFGTLVGNRGGSTGHGKLVQFYADDSTITLEIDQTDSAPGGRLRLDSSVFNVADGEWHKIAGVRAGPRVWLYVDGVLQAARTSSLTADVTNAWDFTVGVNDYERAHPELNCGCRFDDVQIYSRALNALDIQTTTTDVAVSWGLSTDVPIGRRP